MKIIETVQDMQNHAMDLRAGGARLALVPTMGYLHDGHASLMRAGRRRADVVVTSIFVNPAQFGAGEDFDTYPRDLDRDAAIAGAAGVDVVFAPKASDMYPAGYQTWIDLGSLTEPLCGASRPGHFRGVATVVCKLFTIAMPHVAFFGKKDYQQLAIIRRMTADLNLPVEVVGMPIVREQDGLAMSSRNAYLSAEERQRALVLSRSLAAAQEAYRAGERNVERLHGIVRGAITSVQPVQIDYIDFRHGETLEGVSIAADNTLLALAVKIGSTRLIDNCLLGEH